MENKSVIADSNILIWYLRGLPKIIDGVIFLISKKNLFVTPVIVAEVLAGAKKKENKIILNMFSSMNVININGEMGKIAGKFLNQYSKSHNLKIADALIAAAAVYGNMKLWTLNKKHYPMMKKSDFYEI